MFFDNVFKKLVYYVDGPSGAPQMCKCYVLYYKNCGFLFFSPKRVVDLYKFSNIISSASILA